MMKKFLLSIAITISSIAGFATGIGEKVDEFNGVPVYYNGHNWIESHGLNFASNGYCYGQKWQCVEFIIRYYDIVLHHRFPNLSGNAKDFWNLMVDQGELEKSRGLYQYYNDDNQKPEVNDILVLPFSHYGHVCIVTKVTDNTVEVIQQNIEGKTRETYNMTYANGKYSVSKGLNKPIGWLHKKP